MRLVNWALGSGPKSDPATGVTPVAGSIFGPLFQTHFSKSEFKNEISSFVLLEIQMTLLCVCGVDSFIPKLEHWIEKLCHGLSSKKKTLKSNSWIQIHEMMLRSTSSAEENFLDKIIWITWKSKQILEIWPFLNSFSEKWGPKIDPATGVRFGSQGFLTKIHFYTLLQSSTCHYRTNSKATRNSKLQIGWQSILRLFLKTFDLVPGVPKFSLDSSAIT